VTLPTPEDLALVMALERELQAPRCRADPDRLVDLLDPGFTEIGASGRRWDLAGVLDLLHLEARDGAAAPIEVAALEARALSPDVVQVFWESLRDGRRARRTSIWRRRDGRWRQVYHQGTPVTG
jgi:hypothetical protein